MECAKNKMQEEDGEEEEEKEKRDEEELEGEEEGRRGAVAHRPCGQMPN